MTQLTAGPNTSKKIPLTPGEAEALSDLYLSDGAWTYAEAMANLNEHRFRTLLSEGVLGAQDTDMGPMYHLLAVGRLSVFGTSSRAASLTNQLDRAYVRLSLQQLGGEILTESNPFFKDLAALFPSMYFIEAVYENERMLVTGKLTNGGYTTHGIKRIARIVRSSALHRNFRVAIPTPSTRKGFARAEQNTNILRMIHVLPRTGQRGRFSPVVASPGPDKPDPGPMYTSAHIADLRSNKAISDLTWTILGLTRAERIEHAQQALDVDHVVSESQLKQHYGLVPEDLTGRIFTNAIVRPAKGRGAAEVKQVIVVANQKVARLDDGALVHRLTTAQVRLRVGIPADPERWIVETRGRLASEEPDAVYIDSSGALNAVEADTGHYSTTGVLRKLESFHDQSYQKTYWGGVSIKRLKKFQAEISRDRRPVFVNAIWWNSVTH